MKSILLLTLILLFSWSNTRSQNSNPPDSTSKQPPGFSLNELQDLSKLLMELEFSRADKESLNKEIALQQSQIKTQDEKSSLFEKSISLLKQEVINSRPEWWNHFWIGSISTITLLVTLFVILK
jgi:hypothetical protein